MTPVAGTAGAAAGAALDGRDDVAAMLFTGAALPVTAEAAFRWKSTLTCVCTAMGWPFNFAGWYFHERTESAAACRKRLGPETACACVTVPLASTRASTTTTPSTLLLRAIAG